MLTWQLYCALVRGTGRAGTRAKKGKRSEKRRGFTPVRRLRNRGAARARWGQGCRRSGGG